LLCVEVRPIMELSTILLIFIPAGILYLISMRYFVHICCFYGMSKTRKRKILKTQIWWQKILMSYALKHNQRRRTLFCLFCYYVFCIGWSCFVTAIVLAMFIPDLSSSPWIELLIAAWIAFYVCGFSFLFPLKKENK